jgi:hypothetical protein
LKDFASTSWLLWTMQELRKSTEDLRGNKIMVYICKTLLQDITSGVPDHLYESKHATACEIWLKIPFQQGQHF